MTRLLASHARGHGPAEGYACLANLAQGTVCEILDQEKVKPHKVRYCLEQRDPDFAERMAEGTGMPIVLAPPNDLLGLAITEGIEGALTVHAATGLGAWAAGAAGRMPALVAAVPDYIDCVTIYAHPDDAGRRGAREIARALATRTEVFIEGI